MTFTMLHPVSLAATMVVALAGCATTGAQTPSEAGGVVTFESLLAEMTDLERLVEHPGAAYQYKQASSYDRRSTDPTVLTDENWFANLDVAGPEQLQQFVRVEGDGDRREFVLMEADGPGAILWIWFAANIENFAGNIRIYLDHASEPALDMKADDLLGGDRPRTYFLSPNLEAKPFTGVLQGEAPFPSPITGQYSFGWNSYLPIPYASHCKVTTTEVNSEPYHWYQVAYRHYKPGTKVETFTLDTVRENADAIVKLAKQLEHPVNLITPLMNPSAKAETKRGVADLQPGQSTTLELTGSNQAIYRLTNRTRATNMEGALRGCMIEIWFDDQMTVQCPLGDFFATAPGLNCYESLSSAVMDDGTMISNWIMPFKKSAVLSITNHTDMPVRVENEVLVADRAWRPNTMYFHAKWRAEEDIPTRPRRDWNCAELRGSGRYLGNMLHVGNPNKNWWGEGDVKIYFDGEAFPGVFSTGTEDYYGYAMCWRDRFTHAYHNQTHTEKPGNSGHTCLSRFHILDDMPFTTSLKFDMEVWHLEECLMNYAATSWWYALPGSGDNFQSLDPRRLRITQLPMPEEREGRTGWAGE